MKKKGEPFDAGAQAADFKDKIQNSADRQYHFHGFIEICSYCWAYLTDYL